MRQEESGALNIHNIQDTAMNVVEMFASVFARPLELILRPQHGSRYFPPPVIFLSSALMLLLPAVLMLADTAVNMIPFSSHARGPLALFDIGSLSKLYFLLSFVHGIRIWRRMIDMSREQHSEFPGPPLPFFYLIPYGKSFWLTRIVLEPLVVIIGASILQHLFIFQSSLATFLQFAALCLAMKSFIHWYMAWEFSRKLMDNAFAGPIIANLVSGKASDDDLSKINMASIPKSIPEDVRHHAVTNIARAYGVEMNTANDRKGASND